MLKRLYVFACIFWAAFVVFVAATFHTGEMPMLQEVHDYFFMLAIPILVGSAIFFGVRWVITGRTD